MPTPAIGPGEILMRVRASGICGSDLMEWYRLPKAPLVLGHEVSGEVVETGEGVDRFRPGDRVIATARDDAALSRLREAGAEPLRLDVANAQSVSALAWQLDGESLDTAWYVAGVMDRADATQPPTREAPRISTVATLQPFCRNPSVKRSYSAI
jgi:NADPH:quinone reductase-like Zn-dependent oxidoreductase